MSKVRIALLVVFVVLIAAGSVFLGPRIISPFGMSGTDREILVNIRLPRVLVALLMGMALGASGALLQGILRNPLADPYILGISSGASLTAALGIIGGFFFLGSFTVPDLALVSLLYTSPSPRA